jgi:hypothetical protein
LFDQVLSPGRRGETLETALSCGFEFNKIMLPDPAENIGLGKSFHLVSQYFALREDASLRVLFAISPGDSICSAIPAVSE